MWILLPLLILGPVIGLSAVELGSAREGWKSSYEQTGDNTAPQASRPLSWIELASMLVKNVPQDEIVSLLNERSLGFPPVENFLDPLQAAGAKEPLLEAIRRTGKSVKKNLGAGPKEVSSAEDVLRGALRTQPKNYVLHYILGVTLHYKAQLSDPEQSQTVYEDAVREVRKSIELHPDNYFAHFDLGVLLENKFPPDRSRAISEYRRAIVLKPDFAQGYVSLGDVLWWKRDWNGRISAYESAVRLAPDNPEYHVAIGNALYEKRDFAASSRECLEALRLDAKNNEAANCLQRNAEQRRESGDVDVDGIIQLYRGVLSVRPDDAESYFGLSQALFKKGEGIAAEAALRRACELDKKYCPVDITPPLFVPPPPPPRPPSRSI